VNRHAISANLSPSTHGRCEIARRLLPDEAVKSAGEDMANQMIIVAKSAGNDWCVLNSNSALGGPNNTGGTSTCDRLLVYT
jgi:hypothetical protein